MASAGTLNIAVKADVEQAKRSFQEVGGKVGEFRDAMTRVELSQRDAKQAIGTLTATIGRQGGVVAEVAKNILEMGPALGLAVGAVAAFNHIMEESAAVAKLVSTNLKVLGDASLRIEELKSGVKFGFEDPEVNQVMDSLTKQLDAAHEKAEELNDSWLSMPSNVRAVYEEIEKLQNKQGELAKVARDREAARAKAAEAARPAKDMDEALFRNKLGATNSTEEKRGALAILKGAEGQIADYEKWKTTMLEIRKLEKELAEESANKIFEENEKKKQAMKEYYESVEKSDIEYQEKISAENEKRAKKAEEIAERKARKELEISKKWYEAGLSEAEKLQEQIDELMNSELNDPIKRKALEAIDKKLEKPAGAVGFAGHFDSGRVDLGGLAKASEKVQETKDPVLHAIIEKGFRDLLKKEDGPPRIP